MGRLLVKPGTEFGMSLAFAGARILDVAKKVAELVEFDIVITSARDGVHSGPNDPHHSGEAFDFRTNTLQPDQKARLLTSLQNGLYTSQPRRFYAFLEDVGGPNEHIHVQRRAGTTYSVFDYLSNA
jgi:hypothetical protein